MRNNHRHLTLLIPFALMLVLSGLMFFSTQAYESVAGCALQIGSWQQMVPVPSGHIESGSAVVNNKLYIFGGFKSYDTTLRAGDLVHVYDPATNTWETRQPVPYTGSHFWAANDGRYVYLVGGFLGDEPGVATDQAWRYDTLTDSWSSLPSLPEPRAGGGLVVVGHELHYLSGALLDRQTMADTHLVLDLDNLTGWTVRSIIPRPRNHFQAIYIDGVIYMVGGQYGHDKEIMMSIG